jgi:hypothetical protein
MVPLETKSKYVVHLGEFPFYQGSVVLIVAPSTKGIPPTLLLQPRKCSGRGRVVLAWLSISPGPAFTFAAIQCSIVAGIRPPASNVRPGWRRKQSCKLSQADLMTLP